MNKFPKQFKVFSSPQRTFSVRKLFNTESVVQGSGDMCVIGRCGLPGEGRPEAWADPTCLQEAQGIPPWPTPPPLLQCAVN